MLSTMERQQAKQILQENEYLINEQYAIEKYLKDKGVEPEDYNRYSSNSSFGAFINDIIAELYQIKQSIENNHRYIINLIRNPILSTIQQDGMVDVKSLHDKGFDVIPVEYLEVLLEIEIENNTVEKIYLSQKDINLYKSKTLAISDSDMESAVLEID